jgi:ATP-dependent DNA helicase RecG
MAHPELVAAEGCVGVRAQYPKIGLGPERIRSLIAAALQTETLDPVPAAVAEREGLEAVDLGLLHAPEEVPSSHQLRAARERLAWAEAFARLWLRLDSEQRLRGRPALALPRSPDAVERLRAELGFAWTASQERAIGEIATDLTSTEPMRRLLLGDVGSGKTAVALSAAAQAIEAGAQAVVFAPTTPLADQYARTAKALERALGVRTALLTGATPAKERAALSGALERGEIALLIGTHALLSDPPPLPRLGLVVVDEQHRLGVGQRLALGMGAPGSVQPHLLTLSATPIPRTLALALRGELSTSELSELPPGRKPVETACVARSDWSTRVEPAIEQALAAGHGVYVVCPRVGDDDDDDDASGPGAVERHAALASRFGADSVVLAHGRLPAAALQGAIAAFAAGERRILVGTTVVEVGLDVGHATLMVIDGADQFGLSQLHQLRGRVGRSERASRCLLVHPPVPSDASRARLDALVSTQDGAEIAQLDLALRGPGDLDGTRQSGQGEQLVLDAFAQAPWLARIGDDVATIRAADPALEAPAHLGLRLAVERLPARLSVREEAG